jgi:hypothetical protein
MERPFLKFKRTAKPFPLAECAGDIENPVPGNDT